jgi:hypothetical protein
MADATLVGSRGSWGSIATLKGLPASLPYELSLVLDQLSSMNLTFPDQPPDETTLLQRESAPSRTSYLSGVIGKLDLTLRPMIPAGSIVQVDTSKREISPRKEWTHEFQRPIYFLKSKEGFFCGWCELDEESQRLTLIPHPVSSTPVRSWRYGTEVENLGRVVSIVTGERMNLTG